MVLIDEIKAIAGEGKDLAGIESELNHYVDMRGVSKDNLVETLKKHPTAISAFDSINGVSVENGVTNYKTGKMQDEWKEKEAAIRAEVNPKETSEQKEIRELKEWKQESINGQKLSTLKDELSIKAKELKFDSEIARKMAGLGDGVEPLMKEIIAWKDQIMSDVIKGQYTTTKPKTSVDINQLSILSDSELYTAASDHPTQKAAILEEIKRRTRPK